MTRWSNLAQFHGTILGLSQGCLMVFFSTCTEFLTPISVFLLTKESFSVSGDLFAKWSKNHFALWVTMNIFKVCFKQYFTLHFCFYWELPFLSFAILFSLFVILLLNCFLIFLSYNIKKCNLRELCYHRVR